jgi:hypothetical protein
MRKLPVSLVLALGEQRSQLICPGYLAGQAFKVESADLIITLESVHLAVKQIPRVIAKTNLQI